MNEDLWLDKLTQVQRDQFSRYCDLLVEWNEKINLTTITQRDDIYLKHFYDSVILDELYDLKGSLCDVGSGAGFPGIPLKIVKPELDVVLMEPIKKRCVFLETVIKELGLKGITVINARAEDYKERRFDYTTARAVAALNILCELCLPLTKKGGHFLAMKSVKAHEELEEAQNAIRILGGKVFETREITLSGEMNRVIINIEKIKGTPAGYPRRYALIKKKPL